MAGNATKDMVEQYTGKQGYDKLDTLTVKTVGFLAYIL